MTISRNSGFGARLRLLAIGGLASFAIVSSASAMDLTLATGVAPGSVGVGYEAFKTYLEENGDFKTTTYGIELFDLKQTAPAVRDGSVDVGHVSMPLFPAEFSETNLVGDLTLLANIGEAPVSIGALIGAAMTEYVLLNCKDCWQQNLRQNQVYLGTGTGTQWGLLCTKPIRNADDIKGTNFKATAGVFRRWVEHFGGTGMAINPAETFEALSQGIIDCTVNAIPEMSNYSLFGAVKTINDTVPGGTYGGVALTNVNLDVWRSLSVEQRQVFLGAAARAAAAISVDYYRIQTRDLEQAKAQGIIIDAADESLVKATIGFIEQDVPNTMKIYTDTYKLGNVEQKVEIFRGLVEKWKKLTNEIDPLDVDALAGLYNQEIYSKLDVANYPEAR